MEEVDDLRLNARRLGDQPGVLLRFGGEETVRLEIGAQDRRYDFGILLGVGGIDERAVEGRRRACEPS